MIPREMIRKVSTLLVFFICLLSFEVSGQNDDALSQENLVRLKAAGGCTTVISLIDAAIQGKRANAKLLIDRAECFLTLNLRDETLEAVRTAVFHSSMDRAGYPRADGLLFRMNRLDISTEIATKLVSEGRFLSEAYQIRSRNFATENKLMEALKDYVQALDSRAGADISFINHFAITKVLEASKKDPRALEYYSFAFAGLSKIVRKRYAEMESADPNSNDYAFTEQSLRNICFPWMSQILFQWAEHCDALGLIQCRKEAINNLSTLEPKSHAYRTRSAFFKRWGRLEEMRADERMVDVYTIQDLTKMIQTRGTDSESTGSIYLSRGRLHLKLGDLENARIDFLHALCVNPKLESTVQEYLSKINKH